MPYNRFAALVRAAFLVVFLLISNIFGLLLGM